MTSNTQDRLPDNKLLKEILDLKKQVAWMKTKQTSGSDVLAVETGSSSLSSNYNLTTSYADIGLSTTITPVAASTAIVIAVCNFDANAAACSDDLASAILLVDSVAQSDSIVYLMANGNAEATVGNIYGISLTAAAHTIKIQAKNATAARGRITTDSTLSYFLFKT